MHLVLAFFAPIAAIGIIMGAVIGIDCYRRGRRDPHLLGNGVVRASEAAIAIRRGRALLDEADPAWQSRAHAHFTEAVVWLGPEYRQRKREQERRPTRRGERRVQRLEQLLNAAILGQRQARALPKF